MSNFEIVTTFVPSQLRSRHGIFIIFLLLFMLIYALFYFEVPLSSTFVKRPYNDNPEYTRSWIRNVNHDNRSSITTTMTNSSSINNIAGNSFGPSQIIPETPLVRTRLKNPGVEKCHVVFIKVHKAASSTMQNILLRFAMSRNLNVLFMKNSLHINEHGTHINANEIVSHPDGMKFDMLCNHLIYNRAEIATYFPEDTVYIGVVREPFSQFKSAFVYYSQIWKHQNLLAIISKFPDDPIHGLLQDPWNISLNNPRDTLVNNRMSVDFGYPVSDTFEMDKKDRNKIEDFVNRVHKEVDLVLISDLFDESLVLLRRFMNWSFKDIIYFKNNVFKEKGKYDEIPWIKKENYSQEDLDMFRKWAAIDYALYETSLEIFHKKISMEDRFQSEVDAFIKVKQTLADFCGRVRVNDATTDISYLIIDENEWTISFKVTAIDCVKMKVSEPVISGFAKRVQSIRMEKMDLLNQLVKDQDVREE